MVKRNRSVSEIQWAARRKMSTRRCLIVYMFSGNRRKAIELREHIYIP